MSELESQPHAGAAVVPPRVPWLHVVAAGLALTVINAGKPLHMDDPTYLRYGVEFISHPLDPYAFTYGSPGEVPANDLLVPPVIPYWLGIGHALLGNEPVLLKLWLAPFALILAGAFAFLAARFAPTLRVPVLWLGLLSPAVLPGFNLMLEVPVLALGFAAIILAMLSVERQSWLLTLAAGVLAGVTIQTKYTGIVAPAVILIWCVIQGHRFRGAVVIAIAIAIAVGWECVVAQLQGESHFLVNLRQRQGKSLIRMAHLVLPLFTHVGGLAPAVALLGLRALGRGSGLAVAAGAAVVVGFATLTLLPSQVPLYAAGGAKLTPSSIVYGLLAVVVWITFISLWIVLLRRGWSGGESDRRDDLFLLAWLVVEIGAYFALTPFPAARRVVGLVLVLTLIAGRAAHLRGIPPRAGGVVAAFGVGLALVFFGVDLLDARAARRVAHEVARGASRPVEGGTFWHVSLWGFSYYAEREGLLPLKMNRVVPRPGDLIAVQDMGAMHDALRQYRQLTLEHVDTVEVSDGVPLRLVPNYYAGRTPMENLGQPRYRVLIYRVVSPQPPNGPAALPGR